jgi:hypothetical protein
VNSDLAPSSLNRKLDQIFPQCAQAHFVEVAAGFNLSAVGARCETTEFNELLPDSFGDRSAEKTQIWIIGSREQMQCTINEFM